MENLIEILHNTVAFLFAMRILIVVAMVIIVARLAYLYFYPDNPKKPWPPRKKNSLQ